MALLTWNVVTACHIREVIHGFIVPSAKIIFKEGELSEVFL